MKTGRPAVAAQRTAWAVSVGSVGTRTVSPGIVRSQAIDFVREKYGRELALGEVRINPFKLQAEIKDLSLPDTDGKPMLAFRRFFVDFELSNAG